MDSRQQAESRPLGDPSHLESVVSTIKRIEGVYDAYRIVPGKGG